MTRPEETAPPDASDRPGGPDPLAAPAAGRVDVAGSVALDEHDPTLLRMAGEVDMHAVETAGPLLQGGLREVEEVDAEGVTFIDSMGLHCLITAAVAARHRGSRVRLLRPSRPVLQMLDVTAMRDFFDVAD